MISDKGIFEESLVNHLYFAESIRSFCISIGLTFFKNNQEFIDQAVALGYRATDIINQTISYMNKDLANIVLTSDVYITPHTKDLSLLTERLFDINLFINIDKDIEILKSRGNVVINDEVIEKIDKLNIESLSLIKDFKDFCLEIKNKLINQDLFSYLYIDFFNYMYDEISVYGRDIERIISKKDYTNLYLNEFVYYFNELLKKSAMYIRGFLDTKNQDVFDMASFYVNAFANLTEKYLKNNQDDLSMETERLVINYQKYVVDVINRLLNSNLYFITPPITLDNFLTNINVYLLILKMFKKNYNEKLS